MQLFRRTALLATVGLVTVSCAVAGGDRAAPEPGRVPATASDSALSAATSSMAQAPAPIDVTSAAATSVAGATRGNTAADSSDSTMVFPHADDVQGRETSYETLPSPTSTTASSAATTAEQTLDVDIAQVMAVLDTLPVKGRAPKTGYDRAHFGPAWSDAADVEAGRNGCDTRNDILRRDLRASVTSQASDGCLVVRGQLVDVYTGKTIDFMRGQVTSAAVQVDHVVALSDAWQKGAQQLTPEARMAFANDPLNLQAVDGPINQQKGDGDAATWLPPHRDYRCTYVARQVLVKERYGLWVTSAEYDAISRVLGQCRGPLTMPGVAPVPDGGSEPPPTDCYPLSNKGNCYEMGQQCAKRYYGDRGVNAHGEPIRCIAEGDVWRWRAAS